ncbi:SRPBCC domain-containing protein [Paenibacillus pinihumi]|uniref:SRPBCC domain-containing protein n=1 Tax=Paenibacillus pinihumi TaxID=669462 RepID=UPI00040B4B8A|nr:SRPBCC domain-containing protein [Paenibacillus pinihumi]
MVDAYTNKRIDTASRVIRASAQVIYQAMLKPEALALWLPPEGMSAQIDTFDTREGGIYNMTLIYEGDEKIQGKTSENRDVTEGVFLELIPDERIVKTVHFHSEDTRFSGEMIQKWLLEAHSEGTKVTVICEDVPEGIRKEDHDVGLRSTLENLAVFTE